MEVWIGQFEVSGPKDHSMLHGNAGAFVWVAAQATDAQHFYKRVQTMMDDYGLQVVEAVSVDEVLDDSTVSDANFDLIQRARSNETWVLYGTWHMFENQDA